MMDRHLRNIYLPIYASAWRRAAVVAEEVAATGEGTVVTGVVGTIVEAIGVVAAIVGVIPEVVIAVAAAAAAVSSVSLVTMGGSAAVTVAEGTRVVTDTVVAAIGGNQHFSALTPSLNLLLTLL